MVLLVAFSRLYLGAHYLSDVVAAAAVAGFWLTLGVYIVHGCPQAATPEPANSMRG